jgi:hypothetical protein
MRPAWIPQQLGDWPEDYADEENGCYGHQCLSCRKQFTGHKHRPPTCKVCANAAKAIWDALSPDEQNALTQRNEEEFVRIMAEHQSRDTNGNYR